MHFTEEKNLLHFIYILPFSHNKALVESTVFSKEVFKISWYREKINEYLNQKNITILKKTALKKV